jgi:hypothetical protein
MVGLPSPGISYHDRGDAAAYSPASSADARRARVAAQRRIASIGSRIVTAIEIVAARVARMSPVVTSRRLSA